MTPTRPARLDARGFSAVELLVVVAIIGTLAAVATPALLSYWRASKLGAGAAELQTVLGRGRQEAIRRNDAVCVEHAAGRVRLRLSTCGAGPVITLPGTDGNGWFTLANDVEVAAATASVAFTYLGAASTPGRYTVRDRASTAQTVTVTVAASGRVSIP
jgi:prepilin-type N-terminal cleavage/methylation domain-containing protein